MKICKSFKIFPISITASLQFPSQANEHKEKRLAALPISQLKQPIRLVDKEKALHGFFFSYFQPKKVPRTFLATQIGFSDFVGC